jgi:hypothetical protein
MRQSIPDPRLNAWECHLLVVFAPRISVVVLVEPMLLPIAGIDVPFIQSRWGAEAQQLVDESDMHAARFSGVLVGELA